MQQIGQQEVPNPSATNATLAYAMPISKVSKRFGHNKSKILTTLNRNWVLYRTLIIRIAAAIIVAFVLAGGFFARDGISQTIWSTGDMLAGRVADTGFGIEEIAITGQVMAKEIDITNALKIEATTNSINFDVEAARLRLIELPAIMDASVRKIYPQRLIVEVSEVTPVARWRIDGLTFVVDAKGNQIADATGADEMLPLVIGDGAADDANAIIQQITKYPNLMDGLFALSRIADRRWDVIYNTGLRIRLPELNVETALKNLEAAQSDFELLDRDLVLIDMRVPGSMALRPAQRQDPEDPGHPS